MDLSRFAQQLARKVLSDPAARAKLYEGFKNVGTRFSSMFDSPGAARSAASSSTTSSTGRFKKVSQAINDWRAKFADPKQREAVVAQIAGFIAVNFMGIIFLFQGVSGLYKAYVRNNQERQQSLRLTEQRKAEQDRFMRSQQQQRQERGKIAIAAEAAAGAVGRAAEQVTWASIRGANWAIAEGGSLLDHQQQVDPLARSVFSDWMISGIDETSRLTAPIAVDPLYNVTARPSHLF